MLSDSALIEEALDMGGHFNWFDNSFLLSMQSSLAQFDRLTDTQRKATERIYNMLSNKLYGD